MDCMCQQALQSWSNDLLDRIFCSKKSPSVITVCDFHNSHKRFAAPTRRDGCPTLLLKTLSSANSRYFLPWRAGVMYASMHLLTRKQPLGSPPADRYGWFSLTSGNRNGVTNSSTTILSYSQRKFSLRKFAQMYWNVHNRLNVVLQNGTDST